MSLSQNTSNLSTQSILSTLTAEKNRLVTEGKYLEANEVKKKINKLKQTNLSTKQLSLTQSQTLQNESLESAFNTELKNVQLQWEAKLQNFITNAQETEKEMELSHNAQMEELINTKTNKYPPIKYSKTYLDTKAIELNLAKQERFKEAHYYRMKCNELEKKENEKYEKERNANIQLKAEALGNRQAMERKILREKLDMNYELLNKQKDKEIQMVIMKYKNLKGELDYVHKIEKSTKGNSLYRDKGIAKRVQAVCGKNLDNERYGENGEVDKTMNSTEHTGINGNHTNFNGQDDNLKTDICGTLNSKQSEKGSIIEDMSVGEEN